MIEQEEGVAPLPLVDRILQRTIDLLCLERRHNRALLHFRAYEERWCINITQDELEGSQFSGTLLNTKFRDYPLARFDAADIERVREILKCWLAGGRIFAPLHIAFTQATDFRLDSLESCKPDFARVLLANKFSIPLLSPLANRLRRFLGWRERGLSNSIRQVVKNAIEWSDGKSPRVMELCIFPSPREKGHEYLLALVRVSYEGGALGVLTAEYDSAKNARLARILNRSLTHSAPWDWRYKRCVSVAEAQDTVAGFLTRGYGWRFNGFDVDLYLVTEDAAALLSGADANSE